jgi:hypothetical protein
MPVSGVSLGLCLSAKPLRGRAGLFREVPFLMDLQEVNFSRNAAKNAKITDEY